MRLSVVGPANVLDEEVQVAAAGGATDRLNSVLAQVEDERGISEIQD